MTPKRYYLYRDGDIFEDESGDYVHVDDYNLLASRYAELLEKTNESSNEIFNLIKAEFGKMWTFKERGQTLEVITPFSTTTNKFISVFITQRNDKFIVTDGGYIENGAYWIEAKKYANVDYFANLWGVARQEVNGVVYYYNYTSEKAFIPNSVYALCNFIAEIIRQSDTDIPTLAESGTEDERELFTEDDVKKAFFGEDQPENTQNITFPYWD